MRVWCDAPLVVASQEAQRAKNILKRVLCCILSANEFW
jgi:hypothetical protein